MVYDFFVAYAHADERLATQLFDGLTSLGARAFCAARSLRLGDDWDVALSRAQRESRVTVVIVSVQTERSFYEREEIATAIDLARRTPDSHRVVPLYVGDALQGPVPYGLRVKHGLVINGDAPLADSCRRLVEALPLSAGPRSPSRPSAVSYDVDVCMCIVISNSLQWLVTQARRQLLTFGHDIMTAMHARAKHVDRLRASIVTFGADPTVLRRSPLIELPSGAGMLYQLVSDLHISGSGFLQSLGLDAIELAMRSDWSTRGDKRRHIITVWTDRETASTRPLDDLTSQWEKEMDRYSKRLLLFAPNRPAWSDIGRDWENTIHVPVSADGGFSDVEYAQLLAALCNSV